MGSAGHHTVLAMSSRSLACVYTMLALLITPHGSSTFRRCWRGSDGKEIGNGRSHKSRFTWRCLWQQKASISSRRLLENMEMFSSASSSASSFTQLLTPKVRPSRHLQQSLPLSQPKPTKNLISKCSSPPPSSPSAPLPPPHLSRLLP